MSSFRRRVDTFAIAAALSSSAAASSAEILPRTKPTPAFWKACVVNLSLRDPRKDAVLAFRTGHQRFLTYYGRGEGEALFAPGVDSCVPIGVNNVIPNSANARIDLGSGVDVYTYDGRWECNMAGYNYAISYNHIMNRAAPAAYKNSCYIRDPEQQRSRRPANSR